MYAFSLSILYILESLKKACGHLCISPPSFSLPRRRRLTFHSAHLFLPCVGGPLRARPSHLDACSYFSFLLVWPPFLPIEVLLLSSLSIFISSLIVPPLTLSVRSFRSFEFFLLLGGYIVA